MTTKPSYILHTLDERELTVDWFFGPGHFAKKFTQLVLVLIGWFFAILPVVVTASALVNRDNPDVGWWTYVEGFELWDTTIMYLGILFAVFVVGYLALYLVNRAMSGSRNRRKTFDEERLEQRLGIAEAMYAEKFGPQSLRVEQSNVQIQPYANLETYELRGLYRSYGVK